MITMISIIIIIILTLILILMIMIIIMIMIMTISKVLEDALRRLEDMRPRYDGPRLRGLEFRGNHLSNTTCKQTQQNQSSFHRIFRGGDQLSNATCLTHVVFKSDKPCSKFKWPY